MVILKSITVKYTYHQICKKLYALSNAEIQPTIMIGVFVSYNMSNLPTKAQLALVRLLIKTKQLAADSSLDGLVQSACEPLSYFANKGVFEERLAAEKIAQELNIPFTFLNKSQIESAKQVFESLPFNKIPRERWRQLKALPISFDVNANIILANPLDHETKSAIEFDLGCSVKIAMGLEKQILSCLDQNLVAENKLELFLTEQSAEKELEAENASLESSVDSNDLSAAPVVKIVNKILSESVKLSASDIHIVPEKNELSVRVRVDGILSEIFVIPNSFKNSVTSRLKLLAGMDISEKRLPQDGRLAIQTMHGARDLRLSSLPSAYGENIVARILNSDLQATSLEASGMPLEIQQQVERCILGSSKVVLVCGPTGSGKTSTLYSCLLFLRDGKRNLMTVEDPIEYKISAITQIQVNSKIGLTFAQGLRSILRQDPDVIMLGEIRDQETAGIAMQAAQTGHLVLSTLHTNSCIAAITRLKDLGVAPYLIASSVGGVVAQRLVRKLCPDCKKPASEKILKRLKDLNINTANACQAHGCEKCSLSGYRGRTGVFSFLEISGKIQEAIREDRTEHFTEEIALRNSYIPIEQAGINLVESGITSIDELERVLGPLDGFLRDRKITKEISSANGISLKKKKLLLVEDEENTRTVMEMLFQREMYEVFVASNGQEAMQQLYQNNPEIILCDVMMPKMNGLEFLQRLKANPSTKHIPIIMLTAADSEEQETKLLDYGADDFVSKAASTNVMLSRVRRLVQRL